MLLEKYSIIRKMKNKMKFKRFKNIANSYLPAARKKAVKIKIEVNITSKMTIASVTRGGNLYMILTVEERSSINKNEKGANFAKKIFQLYLSNDTAGEEKKRTQEWSIPSRLTTVPNSTTVRMSLYKPISALVRLRASIIVPNICKRAMDAIIINTLEIIFCTIAQ